MVVDFGLKIGIIYILILKTYIINCLCLSKIKFQRKHFYFDTNCMRMEEY